MHGPLTHSVNKKYIQQDT